MEYFAFLGLQLCTTSTVVENRLYDDDPSQIMVYDWRGDAGGFTNKKRKNVVLVIVKTEEDNSAFFFFLEWPYVTLINTSFQVIHHIIISGLKTTVMAVIKAPIVLTTWIKDKQYHEIYTYC